LSSEEFVAWATDGTEYAPEPSVHRVLLIPQLTYRPWTIVSDIEDTKVFYYPIPNTSIFPDDKYLPNYLFIQKHKALGDEVRLRMIKLLSERDCSLKEITEQLELGKSTVHHHLKILRAASLVGNKSSNYYLKEQSLASLSKELELYLNQ
jgi:biotin operon repressor